MGVRGWIIDAEPGENGVRLLMATTDGGIGEVGVGARYRGYILPVNSDPEEILRSLSDSELVLDTWIEEWLTPPRYREYRELVVYETSSIRKLRIIQGITRRRGVGISVNDYPDPLVTLLWRMNIPLMTLVDAGPMGIKMLEDPVTVDYRNPVLKTVKVRLLRDGRPLVSPVEKPSHAAIVIDDVDYMVPYHGIDEVLGDAHVHVGFIGSIDRLVVEHDYPGLLSRAAYIWLNNDSLLVGLNGLIEWSRISRLPLHMLDNASIGSVLTVIEALEAYRRRYMVIRGYGRIEAPRSLRILMQHDRGGSIYTPRPGTYWGICQIDYSSLYPSIIMKYNISGETVDDPECTESIEAPGTGHRVCVDRPGIVAETMKKLVPRKEEYRELIAGTSDPGLRGVYEERMRALKWILVASFGYLGYRNSLFGSIMAHEAVTGIDRYITMKAREVLRRLGLRTIHILVDSLFVEKKGFPCSEINRVVMDETGFKSRVEAEYTWLTIPVSSRGTGYSNRYFGRLRDGSLKIKGLYAVRRDTPLLVKKAQMEALEILGEATDPGEYRESLRKARRVYEKYREIIVSGKAPIEELVMTRRVHGQHGGRRDYTARISSRLRLAINTIHYIVAPGRVYVAYEEGPESYDRGYYHELLVKAFREIGVPP